jgi:glycosyltransferase involved in cell wall biosynthesis
MDLEEAIESLKRQSYPYCEIILVIDGNSELFALAQEHIQGLRIILNKENLGLSESRNRALSLAKGDIIAFFDDDAVADPNWIMELKAMYDDGAIAAGGKILPLWLNGEPEFLPEEFYWILGATHRGFPSDVQEVRNTFGSNISFSAPVIRSLGGFKTEIGVKGEGLLQGEETEMCMRMKNTYGKGVVYNPNAIVYHKVYPERLHLQYLMKRVFWQGYSKKMMEDMGYEITEEKKFLHSLSQGAFDRIKKPSIRSAKQLFMIGLLSFAGLSGYLYKKSGL